MQWVLSLRTRLRHHRDRNQAKPGLAWERLPQQRDGNIVDRNAPRGPSLRAPLMGVAMKDGCCISLCNRWSNSCITQGGIRDCSAG
jgi:hypothetical protein